MSETAVEAANEAWNDANFHAPQYPAREAFVAGYAAALSALHAKAGVGVKVKELEWVDTGQSGFLETQYYAVSGKLRHTVHPLENIDTPFYEHYAIRWDPNFTKWKLIFWVGNNGLSGISGEFDALEAAKAAAQSDYETRILSALSTKLQEPVGCQTCEGRGEIGGYQRYGDGDVDLVIEPCPDCSNESVKRVAIQQWKDISAALTLAHQPVTAGWVMVPIEPTFEMADAYLGLSSWSDPQPLSAKDVWDAMVAAAPKSEGGSK